MIIARHDRPQWSMQSRQMLEALGFKPSHPLPKDLDCVKQIRDGAGQTHVIKIIPQVISGRRHHRIFRICECDRLIPFGRVQQHKCIMDSKTVLL